MPPAYVPGLGHKPPDRQEDVLRSAKTSWDTAGVGRGGFATSDSHSFESASAVLADKDLEFDTRAD
jgi:hypothetical protein